MSSRIVLLQPASCSTVNSLSLRSRSRHSQSWLICGSSDLRSAEEEDDSDGEEEEEGGRGMDLTERWAREKVGLDGSCG